MYVARQTNIDNTQWENFDTALKLCGRSRNEFDVSEYVSPGPWWEALRSAMSLPEWSESTPRDLAVHGLRISRATWCAECCSAMNRIIM